MIHKTSSTSIQPILGTHGRGPIKVSARLLGRPCPRHGALEISGKFSEKEGSSTSMCQTVRDRHKGYLDVPDSLSLHYLSTLTELPGKSFLTQSDTEASQYRHCKSLMKNHASPKQTGSTENLSPANCLQNFPKHSLSAQNKWAR